MASPHVAGAFAVLKNARPTATVAEILAALKCSGKPIDMRSVAGFPEVSPVLPRIDLLGAYNRLKGPTGVTRVWTFNTADDAKDWRPFRGVWSTVSGMYQPTVLPNWINSSVPNCDSKLDVTVRIRRVDPTPPNATDPRNTNVWNSGIWLKTTLDHGNETISGYYFAFNKAWWCAVATSPGQPCPAGQLKQGQGEIFRLTNSNAETGTVTGGVLLCWKNTPIVVNGFNTLRAVSNGSTHTLYLNGTLVCSVNDTVYTSGPAVLAAWIPSPTNGHVLQVDSVSIKSLDAVAAPASGSEIIDPMALATPPAQVATGARGRVEGGEALATSW